MEKFSVRGHLSKMKLLTIDNVWFTLYSFRLTFDSTADVDSLADKDLIGDNASLFYNGRQKPPAHNNVLVPGGGSVSSLSFSIFTPFGHADRTWFQNPRPSQAPTLCAISRDRKTFDK